jgi:hypothetical protein
MFAGSWFDDTTPKHAHARELKLVQKVFLIAWAWHVDARQLLGKTALFTPSSDG